MLELVQAIEAIAKYALYSRLKGSFLVDILEEVIKGFSEMTRAC